MMKRILIFALILSLLGLSACSRDKGLEGSWEATLGYEQLNSAGEQVNLGKVEPYLAELKSITLTLSYTFNPDGTYTESCDIDRYNAELERVVKAGVEAYYSDLIAEKSLEMTVSEAMELDGFTPEDLIDGSKLTKYKGARGKYKAAGGKLYLSFDEASRIDKDIYTEYTLQGDTLTLKKAAGDGGIAYLLPLKLERTK